jgi:hypothetical protein
MTYQVLTKYVQSHCKKCKLRQLHKKNCKEYGKLPVNMAETTLWEIACVDLVGPWTVNPPSGKKQLKAFSAICPATGWFKIASIPDKYVDTVMDTFHNWWLTHYPRPIQVIFDNGI